MNRYTHFEPFRYKESPLRCIIWGGDHHDAKHIGQRFMFSLIKLVRLVVLHFQISFKELQWFGSEFQTLGFRINLRKFTEKIHWKNSLEKFTEKIHWKNSLKKFTEKIHCNFQIHNFQNILKEFFHFRMVLKDFP